MGLNYQKDSSNDDSQCSDVTLLSGGERFFATLVLLLALGSGHECPFRGVWVEFRLRFGLVSGFGLGQGLGLSLIHI